MMSKPAREFTREYPRSPEIARAPRDGEPASARDEADKLPHVAAALAAQHRGDVPLQRAAD